MRPGRTLTGAWIETSGWHVNNGGRDVAPSRVRGLKPEAHGRRAADYRSEIGELFTIPNKSALFEAVEGGGVRAVYALRQSITQDPWPDAIPASEELAAAYGIKLMDVLAASLDA